MSHMRCTCGHDIADNTDNLPYAASAYVVRDQNAQPFWDAVCQDLADFAAALAENARETWISTRFGERYPRDLPDRDVLNDILIDHVLGYSLRIYQCETCGRLWIQEAPDSNKFRAFHPEGAWQNTLAVHGSDHSPGDGASE